MEKDIELIENYLNSKLSADEKSMVERRLIEDIQFARRFEIIKNSQVALDQETIAFESDLEAIQSEYHKASEISPWWLKSYSIAAVLLVVSLTFLGYLMWFQSPGPEALYLSYMDIPANNISIRGEPVDEAIKRAMEAYDKENYALALEQLNLALKSQPDHEGALFYSGICKLLLGQYQNSLIVFESFEEMDSSEYFTAAKWYRSLTLLKMDQVEMAKVQLEQLQQLQNGNYSRQAQELLNKLN